MPRQSKIQKQVKTAVQSVVPKVRKKRERKKLPQGFRAGLAVRVSNADVFKGYKLGLVSHPCKYDDGIVVQLTKTKLDDVAEYVCIQRERGDTIVSIERSD